MIRDWAAWLFLGLIMALLLYLAGGCAQPMRRGVSPLPTVRFLAYAPIVKRQLVTTTAIPTRTPAATATATRTATRMPTPTAAPTATPTPMTAPTVIVPDEALRVVTAVNVARALAGLDPLTIESRLSTVAQQHADDMIRDDYHHHDTYDRVGGELVRIGSSTERITALYTPWEWVAENIAGGYTLPEAVVAGWLVSPEHRANMLNEQAVHVGIGYASGNAKYGTRWVMDLGKPGE